MADSQCLNIGSHQKINVQTFIYLGVAQPTYVVIRINDAFKVWNNCHQCLGKCPICGTFYCKWLPNLIVCSHTLYRFTKMVYSPTISVIFVLSIRCSPNYIWHRADTKYTKITFADLWLVWWQFAQLNLFLTFWEEVPFFSAKLIFKALAEQG